MYNSDMRLLDKSSIGAGDGEVMIDNFSQLTGPLTGQATVLIPSADAASTAASTFLERPLVEMATRISPGRPRPEPDEQRPVQSHSHYRDW